MSMTRALRCLCALSLLMSLPLPARSTPPSCTATATGISFGMYLPNNPAVAFTGNVHVLCTGGATTFTIALTGGSSGSVAARLMYFSSAALRYQLYTNAAHTQIWGDGATGSIVGPITASNAVITVYGMLFAGQTVPPGPYADTVQAIVNY